MGYVIYPYQGPKPDSVALAKGSRWFIIDHTVPADILISSFDGGASDNLKELIENSIAWAISETLKGEKDRFLMIEELQELLADEELLKGLQNE